MSSKVLKISVIKSWCFWLNCVAKYWNSCWENLENAEEAALAIASSHCFTIKAILWILVEFVVFSFYNSSWREAFLRCNSLNLSLDYFSIFETWVLCSLLTSSSSSSSLFISSFLFSNSFFSVRTASRLAPVKAPKVVAEYTASIWGSPDYWV